jgi:hypothetical protein
MTNEQRKDALKLVAREVELMRSEDIQRVVKLCKVTLKQRNVVEAIALEVDGESEAES